MNTADRIYEAVKTLPKQNAYEVLPSGHRLHAGFFGIWLDKLKLY
jgi:hypothetical protein